MFLPVWASCFSQDIFYFLWASFSSSKKPVGELASSKHSSAFNAKLPDANLPGKEKNKLEVYMEAKKDSAKKKEQADADPYQRRFYDPAPDDNTIPLQNKLSPKRNIGGGDANIEKVNDQLNRLYAELNKNTAYNKTGEKTMSDPVHGQALQGSPELLHLEKLLSSLQTGGDKEDPELSKLDTMLNKILDIQHPERIKEHQHDISKDQNNIAPTVSSQPIDSSPIALANNTLNNGFYNLEQVDNEMDPGNISTITASIYEDQLLHDGSTVRLRLLQELYIGSKRIPKELLITGICNIGNERMNITVRSINYNNIIYPVNLSAYDIDGIEGLNVPGAVTTDIAKGSLNNALQGVSVYADPSIGAQAAAAGVQTAKSLIGHKLKAIRITAKAGHIVLLKNSTK